MKNIKCISSFFLLFISGIVFSQNIVLKDLPKNNTSTIKFKGDWSLLQNGNDYEIYGESVSNLGANSVDNIIFDAYLVPTDSLISIKDLPNKLMKSLSLGEMPSYSSNDLNMKFRINNLSNLAKKDSKVVITLKNPTTNIITDYIVLKTPLKTDINTNQKTITSNNNIVLRDQISSVNVPKTKSQINMAGIWNLEIDLSKADVKIFGNNNNIENISKNKTGELFLMVYLTFDKPELDKDFIGYELITADIKPIKGKSILENVKIDAKVIKMIPKGTYYASLLLYEKNKETGDYDEVSTIIFDKKFDL